MQASVTVRVAGSTSNLGAGFDCVGVAIGRWIRLTARLDSRADPDADPGRKPGVTLARRGTLAALEGPVEHDLVYRGFVAACGRARREVPAGLALTADS